MYRLALRCVGVALVVGIVAAPVTAAGPSGDAATIAFYRQVQAAYRPVQAVTGIRRGDMAYAVAGTRFTYVSGRMRPAGFRAATESMLFLLRGGRVVKSVDTARAAGLPTLTIVEDATGAWARLNASPGGCYYRNPRGSGASGWGSQFIGLFGHFAPMKRIGEVVSVQSTYPWGKTGHQARELDRISAASKLLLNLQVRVSGPSPFTWSLSGLREEATPSLIPSASPHC